MDLESIREFCLSKPGVTESFPFDEDTLVFKVGGKMFSLVPLEKIPRVMSVKTDPAWSVELREKHSGISGAYHMNKKHWNSLEYEDLPRDLVWELLDHAYQLVFNTLTKKAQGEIIGIGETH